MQVEHVDFVSFFTQDIARAKRFYSDVLGLEVETEGESDMEFRAGQVTLDIFDPTSIGQAFAPSPAGMALRVPDVDATRAELEAKGVVFEGETIQTSVCRQAWFGSRRERAHAAPAVRRMSDGHAERYRASLPTTKTSTGVGSHRVRPHGWSQRGRVFCTTLADRARRRSRTRAKAASAS
jgi:catechol 2,3-dioxygenase-like lactoylglutathione lyase family enzyme